MTDDERGYVLRAKLEAIPLAEQLTKLFNVTARAIVRRVDDMDFVSFDSNSAEALLQKWTEGQIFNDQVELRWRQSADVYDVLLLTEENSLLSGFQPLTGSPYTVTEPSSGEDHGFLLWGTKFVQGSWLETRIPRTLRYPVQTGKKPRLSYYLYKEGAAVRWVRFRGLQEVK